MTNAHLVKKCTLDQWVRRHHVIQARKAFGRGVTALYVFNSLPGWLQQDFIARYGDPQEILRKQQATANELVEDADARAFYRNYRYTKAKTGRQEGLTQARIDEYTLNASVLNALIDRWANLKASATKLNNRRSDIWALVLQYSEDLKFEHPHTLPGSERRIKMTIERYREEGYAALISKKLGNSNTVKISPEAGELLVALRRSQKPRYTTEMIVDTYNSMAPEHGWARITQRSLTKFYADPAVKILYTTPTKGEHETNMTYSRSMKTILPTLANAMWEGDGTRLNLYYKVRKDGKWKLASVNVYVVVDVASEKFIGWSIGKPGEAEGSRMQRTAFRMALEGAGVRPWEIVTDNQGGHKKIASQGFLSKIALSYRNTQACRPTGKIIESMLGLFQKQVLYTYFNFSGLNVDTDVRPNEDLLLANMDLVPDYNGVCEQLREAIMAWNAAPHSTLETPRRELYATMVNDELPAVTPEDYRDIFWEYTERPITFRRDGIRVQIDGRQYNYEVFDAEGHPDLLWRRNNTGRQFRLAYDPDDLTKACLYLIEPDESLKFEADLRPYLTVQRAAQDRTAEQTAEIHAQLARDKAERIELETIGREIDAKWGNDSVRPARLGGLGKKDNDKLDAATGINPRPRQRTESLSERQKDLSNTDYISLRGQAADRSQYRKYKY